MLLLLALATAEAPPRTPPTAQATATVRVLHSSVATRFAWTRLPENQRREVKIRDQQGRELLLRLVENE